MTQKFALSIDLGTFVKDQLRAAADVASGRITPAEADALSPKGGRPSRLRRRCLSLECPPGRRTDFSDNAQKKRAGRVRGGQPVRAPRRAGTTEIDVPGAGQMAYQT